MTPTKRGRVSPPALVFALVALAAGCSEPLSAPDVGAAASRAGSSATGPVVSSFAPTDAPRGITIDLTVKGSGFGKDATVQLEKDLTPAPNITTNSTTFISSKELVASITISADANPDLYDVAVLSNGKRGIGAEKFEVMEVVFLGPLGGERLMWGSAINSLGHVVGPGTTRPFFWSPTTGAEWHSDVWGAQGGINDQDQVVGVTCGWSIGVGQDCLKRDQYGVLWRREGTGWAATTLTARGGTAYDINNLGQIYGNDPGPTRWTITGTGLTRETLPMPPGRPAAVVVRANNTGQAAGNDVVWSFDGASVSFLILPPPAGGVQPSINDLADRNTAGEMVVAGFATFSGSARPVRWRLKQSGGVWQILTAERLADPVKSFQGSARAVNNLGDIVGYVANMGGVALAVRWPLSGPPVLLTRTRDKSLNSWAHAVNDQGWVTGYIEGQYNGAVVWRAP